MEVQVFGIRNDADTRKALRFFQERRVKVHFVDFKIRAPSRGELRRFFQKYGSDGVVDRDSSRFRALGLHAAHYGDDRWIEIAENEPFLLRTPLVRYGQQVTVGHAEDAWRAWTGR